MDLVLTCYLLLGQNVASIVKCITDQIDNLISAQQKTTSLGTTTQLVWPKI